MRCRIVTCCLPAWWAIKPLITTVGFNRGMRACRTCQHIKRPEIDRRLAAGEPLARVAPNYGLTTSSLYRHRTNCLKLASSNAIAKEAARGTAALALLPSKETLSGAYFELRDRIDQIARQAEQQGSLKVALAGLNSIRQTLDSLARLASHEDAEVNVAVQANVRVDLRRIVECVIGYFDHEPEIKARIAQALLTLDGQLNADASASPDHDRGAQHSGRAGASHQHNNQSGENAAVARGIGEQSHERSASGCL
jgi:hypothetical protein